MRRLSVLFFVAIFASLIACSGAQTRPRSPDMLANEGALANRYVPAGSRSTPSSVYSGNSDSITLKTASCRATSIT